MSKEVYFLLSEGSIKKFLEQNKNTFTMQQGEVLVDFFQKNLVRAEVVEKEDVPVGE